MDEDQKLLKEKLHEAIDKMEHIVEFNFKNIVKEGMPKHGDEWKCFEDTGERYLTIHYYQKP